MFTWIDQQNLLNDFCQKVLKKAEDGQIVLAVDTEFIRETTYFPQLCLLQLGIKDQVVLIDTLAAKISLDPLKEIFVHPQVIKVLHAGRQDVEIFYNLLEVIPHPMWDSQIAAMACGFGESVSYDSLVEGVLKQHVDKSSRFTDWAQRPLTAKQCEYAALDVIHLIPIYETLSAQLAAGGRQEWIQDELDALQNSELYRVHPDDVWKKLRSRSLRAKHLPVLQAIAREREIEAVRINVPRGRVVKDDLLVEIALQQPDSFEAMSKIRGIGGQLKGAFGTRLWQAIDKAKQLPKEQWPVLDKHISVPSHMEGLLELLRMTLKIFCDQNNLVPKLIADKGELEQLILYAQKDEEQQSALMQGWRRDLFGIAALDIIKGRKSLGWKKGKVALIAMPHEE